MAALLSLAYASAAVAQTAQTPPGNNPSENLDKSGGVIKPGGNIDPKMRVTPPDPGRPATRRGATRSPTGQSMPR